MKVYVVLRHSRDFSNHFVGVVATRELGLVMLEGNTGRPLTITEDGGVEVSSGAFQGDYIGHIIETEVCDTEESAYHKGRNSY